ncbi:GNAT family N-acetyltransferase [Sphingomicrobium astaxanthinifaciens]|uniref:GNAT family N-acetyltransferase n=1 Tax=Sphingomicrobium astaxanthinifaciens TaxID=1227949 RepID=UPI001FCAFB50|nr:GNAT family N-acetyltransferase [Sphingomicrobium astaxanthinifaciens]MCJ7420656.1 GNAT family N-acetyltransferase [Sphingomicrobium astaxanthinifaciens]
MTFRHETERLVLRDWDEADSRTFWEIMNTPAVMQWLGGPQPFEEWQEGFARLQGYARDYGHCFWLVERKSDGELLGFCGLKRINYEGAPNPGMPEIGWRFRESAWGHGYAKEAAIASLDLAFDRFGYDEVTAVTVSGNAPSWGLMERLGMIERPELAYHDGKYSAQYGRARQWVITAAQWREHRARLLASGD